jgi:hypothetical protein
MSVSSVGTVTIFDPGACGGAGGKSGVRRAAGTGGGVCGVPLNKLVHFAAGRPHAIGRIISELGLEPETSLLPAAHDRRRQSGRRVVGWTTHQLTSADLFSSDLTEQRTRSGRTKLAVLAPALHGLPLDDRPYKVFIYDRRIRADTQDIAQLVYASRTDYRNNTLIECDRSLHLGGVEHAASRARVRWFDSQVTLQYRSACE